MKYLRLTFLISSFLTQQIFAANCVDSSKQIANSRAKFQKSYDKKDYEQAYNNLNSFLENSKCEISSQEKLWMKNDLMLTTVKLKNYVKTCLSLYPDISIAMREVSTSENFKKAFSNVSAYCNGDYFKIMDKINAIPGGAKGIIACDDEEKQEIIELLKKEKINDYFEYVTEGGSITVYKGDFSNRGHIDYAIIFEEGTGYYDSVFFYERQGNKLISRDVKDTFGKVFKQSDNIVDPIAFVKNNKIYIRIMHFPKGGHADLDPSELHICTYLWEGNKITLTGPNYTGTWPDYKVIPYEGCARF